VSECARPVSTTSNLQLENIPAELKAVPQWVVWRYERAGAKWTKIPFDAKTGRKASATNPKTWSTLEAAVSAAQQNRLDGIGFVFSKDDPFCGVDLDDCIDGAGQLVPEAREVIVQLDSYAETSPSRRGVKLWVKGRLPTEGTGRRTAQVQFGGIEVYHYGRFFTVTGWRLPDGVGSVADRQEALDELYARFFETADRATADRSDSTTGARRGFSGTDDELIEIAMASRNGAKFSQLWAGDTTGYPSHSEADLALCSSLAFYAGEDAARIDRLFRRSGLMRPKWDEPRPVDGGTYGAATTQKAIAGKTDFYNDPSGRGHGGAPPKRGDPVENVKSVRGDGWEEPVPFRTDLPDLPPFPVEALPPVLHDFSVALAEQAQVPVDMVAGTCLGATSLAVCGRFVVQPWDGWTEETPLWIAPSAPSGSRKSTVIEAVIRPVYEVERELQAEASPRIAKSLSRKRVAKRLLDKAEKEAAQKPDNPGSREKAERLAAEHDKISILSPPRLVTTNATSEAVVKLLCEPDGRILVASSEAGQLRRVPQGLECRPDLGRSQDVGSHPRPAAVHRDGADAPARRPPRNGRPQDVPRAGLTGALSLHSHGGSGGPPKGAGRAHAGGGPASLPGHDRKPVTAPHPARAAAGRGGRGAHRPGDPVGAEVQPWGGGGPEGLLRQGREGPA
jgi:hypothetical protein